MIIFLMSAEKKNDDMPRSDRKRTRTNIEQIDGKPNRERPWWIRRLRHCTVSRWEISLEGIDRRPCGGRKRDIVQRLSALRSLRICAFVRRSFVVSVRRSRRTNGFVRIFSPPTDVQDRSNHSLGLVIVIFITVTSLRTHFDELALQTNRLTIDLIQPFDPLIARLRQRFVVQIEGAQQFRLFHIVHAEILAEQLSVEFRNRSKAAQQRFSQSSSERFVILRLDIDAQWINLGQAMTMFSIGINQQRRVRIVLTCSMISI